MFEVTPIKAFNDNYLWLFRDTDSTDCGIVDPGDAEPVLRHLQKHNLRLTVIFITHHHADHTGGITRLLEEFDVPVYGPKSQNIPAITHLLAEDDHVEMFGKTFHILEIPGHTLDHIAYYAAGEEDEAPVLFCGDTLFAGGCGRVFEGTHNMMHHSLQKLADLEPATRVYCAHEYTLANLEFARAVTPGSANLDRRIQQETEKRKEDIPTVPTSISLELATNPFLRCTAEDVIAAASKHAGRSLEQPEDVFAAIRSWKDGF